MQCPINAFRYNLTQCACNPGYIFNVTSKACSLFTDWGPVELSSGVDYENLPFPATIFDFDSIKKFTQSQAVFLEATLVMLLSWLFFCFFVRVFGRNVNDGRNPWFKIRWWISRLDICFATRHWLDDQKVVKKRKTELGGTLSIASWILFIGLFAALLYQIISKRSIEVHNVRATNAPDLASFLNDLEFNITTISSMSCSHLRGLGSLVIGTPGFINQRVTPLSSFLNYSCLNTSRGPTITLKCSNCQLIRDNAYVSWQFVDLPNDPATAVGFQFNLTAKNPTNKRHLSSVSGTLKNASSFDDKPITFRGTEPNVLVFNLFPRIYHNLRDLKLIQPLFHEFLPGSFSRDISQLQSSLQSSSEGLINTTLYVNFLSAYIVEIDNQNILGPVSFLADLGGLYCISIGIFFYFLVQCEYRIKKLRNEDTVMRNIRNRRKAQDHWDKLRKYVMYTWGSSSLDENFNSARNDACCAPVLVESFHRNGSSLNRRQPDRLDSIRFNKNLNKPSEKRNVQPHNHTQAAALCSDNPTSDCEHTSSSSLDEPVQDKIIMGKVKDGRQHPVKLKDGVCQIQTFYSADGLTLPLPPSTELKAPDEISMADLQKDLRSLYEYNVLLRNQLSAAQSMLHALSERGN